MDQVLVELEKVDPFLNHLETEVDHHSVLPWCTQLPTYQHQVRIQSSQATILVIYTILSQRSQSSYHLQVLGPSNFMAKASKTQNHKFLIGYL